MQTTNKLLSITYRDSTTSSRYQAVEKVLQTMHEHLDEPLSLHDMAEVAQLSPYHFNRIFHQITGVPPSQFLYALRIEAAKQLLLTTKLSVTDICYETGYNSLGTFISRFTQLVGLSPSRLRQLAEHSSFYRERSSEYLAMLSRIAPFSSNLAGHISTSKPFTGVIVVGLFPTSIPQSKPVSCTVLMTPGFYRMPLVPDGQYYIFATALSGFETSFNLLQEPTLYGSVGPIIISNSQVYEHVDVMLQPKSFTDPPVLTALPFLLSQYLNERSEKIASSKKR
jgi:AraC family transcriptional regulator